MASGKVPPHIQRDLVRAALIDGVCILAGVGLFLATGNMIWVIAGVLLGAGFMLPAVIKLIRAQR